MRLPRFDISVAYGLAECQRRFKSGVEPAV